MAQELNLKDSWRELNSFERFTFFSNLHKSWSGIDMIWMDSRLMENVQVIEILPNTWTDYNPIKMKWRGKRKTRRWTFNKNLLRDKEYIQMVEKELKVFLGKTDNSTKFVGYNRGLYKRLNNSLRSEKK
uniref:Uncharacterized protein n=1 Tax=Micrurus spixii TaxID=129469 RepID=A0A2D4LJE8_9SAUR